MSDACRHCGETLEWEEGCGGLFCLNGCDQTRPKHKSLPVSRDFIVNRDPMEAADE